MRPGARGLSCFAAAVALGLWTPAPDDGRRGDEQPAPLPLTEVSHPNLPHLAESADAARREGLTRALTWLAADGQREPDGSWPTADAAVPSKSAVTALATLALMSGGSPPERGLHGRRVADATDYLLSRAVLDSAAEEVGFLGSLDSPQGAMHAHGFALLALAEAYSSSPSTRRGGRLARALPLAVALIERSQGSLGAWEYEPRRVAAHEGSVTICLVQGLRAARNAGIEVDSTVITRAEDYVLRSQADDGLFRYRIGSNDRSVALTAAAISTLNAAGRYDDSVIRAGVDAIWRELGERERRGGTSDFPYYERFYLAQAFWQLSDTSHFERWYVDELSRVLADQRADGSFGDSPYGSVYATAINALFLALPDALLPVLQR